MSERDHPPHGARGEERDGRTPRPARPRGATTSLVAGLVLAGVGTVLNKVLDADGTGRVLVIMGAVLALAAVWRPEWFGRRGGPANRR